MTTLRRPRKASRQMSAEEEAHIEKVGRARFDRAFDYAQFDIRRDSRFVGLDKLRLAIAYEAALRATGFNKRPLRLPRGAGPGEEATQRIAEELLARAADYAAVATGVVPL
jgi:hypothetical protein